MAGRFVRSRLDLGNPTFIANAAEEEVSDELRKLYSHDANWNVLLGNSSEKATQTQIDLWEFIDGFRDFPKDIPLQYIKPAMSTVIFKTSCEEWAPENFKQGLDGLSTYERIDFDINYQESTLIIVTAKKVPIDWAKIEEIYNWDWELIVVFWDQDQNLLFINSSENSGYYKKLAEAVAGEVKQIQGPEIFRSLAGI